MKKSLVAAALALVSASALLTGCNSSVSNSESRELVSKTFDPAKVATVEVSSVSVPVQVLEASDNNVSVAFYGDDSDKDSYDFRAEQNGSGLQVELSERKGASLNFHLGAQTHLDVRLPKKQFDKLDIHSKSAPIQLAGLQAADVRVESKSGLINADHLQGQSVTVETDSGAVRLDTADGSATIKSDSGMVSLVKIGGPVKVDTQSGAVQVTEDKLDKDISVNSRSGLVTVTAPANASFGFDLATNSGMLNLNFPATYSSQKEHAVKGAVGSGGPQIHVETRSGAIAVTK